MIQAAPGATFEAVAQFASGLTGTVGARIRTSSGSDFLARTTAGVAADVTVGSRTVYRRAFTAPTTAGQYLLTWDDGTNIVTEELVVTSSTSTPSTPGGRDLCVLADVYKHVPGFDPDDPENASTVDKLADEITSRSRSIHQDTGREFVAIAGNDPRTFDLTASICQRRSMPVGDIASIVQVELFDFDGTTSLGVVDESLYTGIPRIREEWEPIERLQFPRRPSSNPLLLAPGRTLVITATWGFPEIPADIREACAALVITTMLTDVAQAGTDLSDALDPTFNTSGLIRYSLDTIRSYANPGFA